ncbi:hypothetical protein LOZ61_001380 [Ophidiomyces ophidiicola]|uniref:Uncharacterized protein n=1 Tax=Ophidiomyces ophidiicola TaxID=1387563 RepID=A0ACB8V605_9EURO|nr:hypothetical protein LOZ61_001380 [Ophidiomyces ophidiicola]KAI1930529.1 hypothetical protein LOZ60_000760 [Ophidiomyces ophidiicola]KAI2131897.1 hypothetical protein LOZ31_000264 [Ophidiomyces ophidiicola]KAI2148060.1 hypothetical protein LOZ27_002090 [Ophidiomyces ophidiicola]KAI2198824.1 hypothetical protein LOZ20_002144 [Ophidiomyces ophidiicola]
MSSSAELQRLFASLVSKTPSSQSSSAAQYQQQQSRTLSGSPGPNTHSRPHYAPPSVSSPVVSPPVAGTPPHHGSDIISPNVPTPRNEANPTPPSISQCTDHLLGLLKFESPTSNGSSPPPQAATDIPSNPNKPGTGIDRGANTQGISASDLVAAFMPKPTAEPGNRSLPLSKDNVNQPPTVGVRQKDDTQDMLLKVLNYRPASKTQYADLPKPLEHKPVFSPPASTESQLPEKEISEERKYSPVRAFGTRESRETTPFEAPKSDAPVQAPIFSYVNPFEQLAAASSSPIGKPGAPTVEDASKRQSLERNVSTGLTRPREEPEPLTKAGSTTIQELRPGKKLKTKETVSDALISAGEEAKAKVETALARPTEGKAVLKTTESNGTHKPILRGSGDVDSIKDRIGGRLEKEPAASSSVSVAVKGNVEKDLADSWENEAERIVPVYGFPLRPFISITWKGTTKNIVSVRDDGFMDIARLKKPFDQLDRSLTSATAKYIIYALSKNGGIRVIRQDDGYDRQVFRACNDRIFNVALCRLGPNSPSGKDEAVLGIGDSGSVYWAPLSKGDENLFEKDALDINSLIFPPFPASDENTSGGQLKTRARPSSRHPEFFAIGRGKSIHIVWPSAALSPKYSVSGSSREVDTEKFYKDRAVKISTGKAGKDFIFSDDDTVIVSLDKTGRLRFWDIHEMVNGNSEAGKADIRVPLLTLVTSTPNEKSWPTSVLFVDKLRPYIKMSAMRYMLVGLRQNHTFQLWDLALGKAVQELSFPHENESDAICSVAYHPASGIIVVGHPTRNSIYFIHLSAPKYTLPPMSQEAYMKGIINKDEQLFGPQSTACMSGLRELSFGPKGELRSLELLPLGKPYPSTRDEDSGLFELYVMHSKGVTCLNIKKADLGWTMDNKIAQHINGVDEDFVEIKELQTSPSQTDEQSVAGEVSPSIVVNGKETAKKIEISPEKPSSAVSSGSQSPIKETKKKSQDNVNNTQREPVEKPDKKKKKKSAIETSPKPKESNEGPKSSRETGPVEPAGKPDTSLKGAELVPPQKPTLQTPKPPAGPSVEGVSDYSAKTAKAAEADLSKEFSTLLSRELGIFYSRFNEDRRAQDELSVSRQDAVLRLISSTLSENVEKSLSRIVTGAIESTVVPSIKTVTTASLEKQFAAEFDKRVRSAISDSVKKSLPDAVAHGIQTPQAFKSFSDSVATAVVKSVESELSITVRHKILPAIKNECSSSTEKVMGDVEKVVISKFQQMENQHLSDSVKIDQLTNQINSLVQVVSTIATSQTKLEEEILGMSRRLEEMQIATQERSTRPPAAAPVIEKEASKPPPEDTEVEEVRRLMTGREYEQASIKWVQSTKQAELFDTLFIHHDPAYLKTVSPIVSLSVSVAVTSSLKTHPVERLNWLFHVFGSVKTNDPDIASIVPKIMDVLIERLQELYMSVASHDPHAPYLRQISQLSRWARQLKDTTPSQS